MGLEMETSENKTPIPVSLARHEPMNELDFEEYADELLNNSYSGAKPIEEYSIENAIKDLNLT